MKRIFVVIVMVIAMAFSTAAPSQAGHRHHRTAEVVTKAEYDAVQIGWTRSRVESFVGALGERTEVWSDGAGNWVQKVYPGSNGAVVYVDYNYNGSNWINRYMTWCPGYDGSVLVCIDTKTNLT